jgi:hypothetical protein
LIQPLATAEAFKSSRALLSAASRSPDRDREIVATPREGTGRLLGLVKNTIEDLADDRPSRSVIQLPGCGHNC